MGGPLLLLRGILRQRYSGQVLPLSLRLEERRAVPEGVSSSSIDNAQAQMISLPASVIDPS
jgi:hypothetical protein